MRRWKQRKKKSESARVIKERSMQRDAGESYKREREACKEMQERVIRERNRERYRE